VTAQIDALLQTRYKDFNDCHATEKLREVEGLRVSRELVRRRRRALGLPAKHRRRARLLSASRARRRRAWGSSSKSMPVPLPGSAPAAPR
jgi:hypothetical protein